MSVPLTLTSPKQIGVWMIRTDLGYVKVWIAADRYVVEDAVFAGSQAPSILPTAMRSVHAVPGEELRIETRGGVGGFDEWQLGTVLEVQQLV